jgi:hypothetical protein
MNVLGACNGCVRATLRRGYLGERNAHDALLDQCVHAALRVEAWRPSHLTTRSLAEEVLARAAMAVYSLRTARDGGR